MPTACGDLALYVKKVKRLQTAQQICGKMRESLIKCNAHDSAAMTHALYLTVCTE